VPRLLPDGDSSAKFDGTRGLTTAADGRILISGGLGGVGSLIGAWLAASENKNAEVMLLGRSGRFASSPLMAALQRSGSPATMARCDVSIAEEAAAAAAGSGKPLAGIVHAGGVLADGMVPNQTASSIRTVFAPKVRRFQIWWVSIRCRACRRTGCQKMACATMTCIEVPSYIE